MTESNKTILTKREIKWIKEQRITRLTDNQEVLIYPMGAERFLSSILFGNHQDRYNVRADVEGKEILLIPGYGNSAFLFAQAGAKSVTVYDKDPVTIAWIKAFKKFYNYRDYNAQGKAYPSIGELLTALTCWYPPLLLLPHGTLKHALLWAINPKSLRRAYIFYMLSLVQNALLSKSQESFELDKEIKFHSGEITKLTANKDHATFDTAYIPYLLGVKNGIETEAEIITFLKEVLKVVPNGSILVSPTRSSKEFYVTGQSYFATTGYSNLNEIPGLKTYYKGEDAHWFKTQGLAVFGLKK